MKEDFKDWWPERKRSSKVDEYLKKTDKITSSVHILQHLIIKVLDNYRGRPNTVEMRNRIKHDLQHLLKRVQANPELVEGVIVEIHPLRHDWVTITRSDNGHEIELKADLLG